MKKIIPASLSLVVLVIFGMVVITALPGRSPTFSLAEAELAPAVGSASFVFDPEAVSYEISQPDYTWIDISAASDEQITVPEPVDNVGSVAFDIGFYFPFFDRIYRQVRVSDNGYLYFDGQETDGRHMPQTVPADFDPIHNLIAPFGTDLFRNAGDSAVYIQRQTEPARRLVVQFEKAYWCCHLESPNSFQAVLYPDGRILTQYQTIGGESPPHNYLTAGIENSDGRRGHNLYTGFLDESDRLGDEVAVLYDPGDTVLGRLRFIPETATVQAEPGQTVPFETDLLNLSGLDSRFTITYTLQLNQAEESSQPEEPAESGQPDEPASDPWQVNLLAEPGPVGNTEARPLLAEITVSPEAVTGDVAVVTFRPQAQPALDLEAVATVTIEVSSD